MVNEKAGSDSGVTHESEVQRQYIRIDLAAKATIDNSNYNLHNLSSGGFSIEAPENVFSSSIQHIKILFDFDNFAFQLDVTARLVYQNKGIAGFAFTELKARQISLLNYIIKSYLSGLIVSEGDLINVATRNDFAKLRDKSLSNDNNYKGWIGKIIPFAVIAFVGVMGLVFLMANLYENTLIIKSSFSVVESPVFTVRAEKNGIFSSLLAQDVTKVNKGQPLAVLKSDPATPNDMNQQGDYVLKSPCDCKIIAQNAQDGEFRVLGESIFELVALDARPWVTANLNPDESHRLKLQDNANFRLVGEKKFLEGHVVDFVPPSFNKPFVQVKIKPVQPLPVETVGRQAYVELSVY